MKKLFILLSAVFALSTTTFAQRIAVVDFNAGAGISQQDVDGIAAIFNTYFSPSGYTFVERTTVDRVISEQNFQRGKMTEQQMVALGKLLNVSKIVIGDINIVSGEYNVDVRVVNVGTGTIVAKEGGTWMSGSTYRELMGDIATRLASQIAINVFTGYKVGDLFDVDGVKGVVFTASSDGSHGRVISCDQWYCDWYTAKANCESLGSGWRLPTKQELIILFNETRKNDDFKDGLFWADAPQMEWDNTYWGEESNSNSDYVWIGYLSNYYAETNTTSSKSGYYKYVRAVYAF